jgi:hypothetical protein
MSQLVAVSRAFQPADKFFGTDWTARFWVRSSNPLVQAQVVIFFEDSNGNSHPSIEDNSGTGTISAIGAVVVGVGTLFTTELVVGDLILAGGQIRRVLTITNNTHLTVDLSFAAISGEEFLYQHYILLDPTVAPFAVDGIVAVATTARDFGRFEALDVKLILNELNDDDVIDIGEPFLINEISKSLHLNDNTIPRNKQREYKMYRMAVANPDIFTEVEAGLVGANTRIDSEPFILTGTSFIGLKNQNLFPFSEVVVRTGIAASGTINYTGQPNDGDTITIGVNIYEFDNNSIFTEAQVPIGATPAETYQSLVDLINVNNPLASASLNASKNTVTITALLPGSDGNAIAFAADTPSARLTPISGTLDGGINGVQYTRGQDYIMRYDEGEIARTPQSNIPDPTPIDLAITYSYFPGDIAMNESYSQTIKPVGVKLEIDPTCLFFFRGRDHDFRDPAAENINFEVVTRTPSRFSHLKPAVRGKYTQVVDFQASPPHNATLDFEAMIDQEAYLVKTTADGLVTTIPFDNPDGWFFTDDQHIRLSTSSKYVRPDEASLFEATAEYEIVYFVKFQFTTAPIGIADNTSAYALVPYSYKSRQVEETKEDVEQTLFFDVTRRAKLRLPAIQDQSLAELSRFLGGQRDILSDDLWTFVDNSTVEVFLSAFDAAAIYTLTYKSSKISYVAP